MGEGVVSGLCSRPAGGEVMEAPGIQGWGVQWYVLLLAHNLERGRFFSAAEVDFKEVVWP